MIQKINFLLRFFYVTDKEKDTSCIVFTSEGIYIESIGRTSDYAIRINKKVIKASYIMICIYANKCKIRIFN